MSTLLPFHRLLERCRLSEASTSTDAARSAGTEINYNCVCDEGAALVCSRAGCPNEISAGSNMTVVADGSVYCSAGCASGI